MPPPESQVQGKTIHSQGREIISNVLIYMHKESVEGGPIIPVNKAQQRCALATGVSVNTVKTITKEWKDIQAGVRTSFSTPGKKRKRERPIRNIDDCDQGCIRRMIHRYIATQKSVPSVEKLFKSLQDDIQFAGGRETLRKILHDLGFRWRKTRSNKKILIEKQDIRLKRIDFLRSIKMFREEKRPVIYMDETYVQLANLRGASSSDESNEAPTGTIGKSQRLSIVHAGGETGFVPDALLTWKSDQATGDCRHQMNHQTFLNWLHDKLIPNLQPNSVLVIENAPYHNVQINKPPTSNCEKTGMQAWLLSHGVPFDADMMRPQLYELIRLNKPRTPSYAIDDLLRRNGHTTLRLPPCHPDLNPIGLIWAVVKKWLASLNVSKIDEARLQLKTKIADTGVADWQAACENVKRIEEEYHTRDQIVDREMESIITRLGGVDSDSDEDSDWEEDKFEDSAVL